MIDMRNIRFRGKRLDNGEWVYGYYVYQPAFNEGQIYAWTKDYADLEKPVEVDPATVGQYTGLKDKNGKDGYEQDTVRRGLSIGIIKFDQGHFYIDWGKNPENWSDTIYVHLPDSEIIGNVHDNPELLGK